MASSTVQNPRTFIDAESLNGYAVLTLLHDHAMRLNDSGERTDEADHHLTELALSAAVVSWWSRWQPISMHRALVAGSTLAEVAAAVGSTEDETYDRWSVWAEQQTRLWLRGAPHTGLDPAEATSVRTRLGHSVPKAAEPNEDDRG